MLAAQGSRSKVASALVSLHADQTSTPLFRKRAESVAIDMSPDFLLRAKAAAFETLGRGTPGAVARQDQMPPALHLLTGAVKMFCSRLRIRLVLTRLNSVMKQSLLALRGGISLGHH